MNILCKVLGIPEFYSTLVCDVFNKKFNLPSSKHNLTNERSILLLTYNYYMTGHLTDYDTAYFNVRNELGFLISYTRRVFPNHSIWKLHYKYNNSEDLRETLVEYNYLNDFIAYLCTFKRINIQKYSRILKKLQYLHSISALTTDKIEYVMEILRNEVIMPELPIELKVACVLNEYTN